MGHKLDIFERIRRTLGRLITGILKGRDKVRTERSEFVGIVSMSEEQFEKRLHEWGFERNTLAWWKYVPGLSEEEGSWRMTDGDYQLHIMLFESDEQDEIYVFAHWEYRWDRYPIRHLRGTNASDTKGVNTMRSILNRNGVEFFNEFRL